VNTKPVQDLPQQPPPVRHLRREHRPPARHLRQDLPPHLLAIRRQSRHGLRRRHHGEQSLAFCLASFELHHQQRSTSPPRARNTASSTRSIRMTSPFAQTVSPRLR
jgi:hypothetical protein